MYCKPDLINAACDYAERSERLRRNYEEKSVDYLKGRIDQYDEGVIPNLPVLGPFLEPQEISVMRSVLEDRVQKNNL